MQSPATAATIDYAFPREKRTHGGRISLLTRLPEDQYQQYLQYLKLGAYDYVAAQCLGISQDTFYKWIRKGLANPKSIYGGFVRDTERAKAHARMMAEIAVKNDSPQFWLTHGPAKRDWSPHVDISMDAAIDMQIESTEGSDETGITPAQTLSGALAVLEQLGFVKRLKVLDAEVVQNPALEGEVE